MKMEPEIRDVFASNLLSEMRVIMSLIDRYPYVSMDTEFPGIVVRLTGPFKNANDYHYQTIRLNVNELKVIQVGITLADENGNIPEPCSTWQFHFNFNVKTDTFAQDSIDLLTNAGIDFDKNLTLGIDPFEFGAIAMMSGLTLCNNVTWVSFHSGYDFAYILKLLTCAPLPEEESDFFDLLKLYFPRIFDMKYMMKSCESLRGGLQQVCDDLHTKRVGPQHQAGSDALMTCSAFFKMREVYFDNKIEDEKFLGQLYGLGQNLKKKL